MAVPAMLLRLRRRAAARPAASARAGRLARDHRHLARSSLVAQPLVAGRSLRAHALGVDGHALLAIVVTSALPTAQNIFVHATRYDFVATGASPADTILVTTIGLGPRSSRSVAALRGRAWPRTARTPGSRSAAGVLTRRARSQPMAAAV